MPNRTAKFVSAVFASVLAGISFTTASHSATPAADDCLSAPNDQTPEGSHWYYRIERGTKRHCWYLREEGEKVSQSAPSNAAPSAKPIAPKAEPPIRGSVANARAELPSASARDAADSSAATTPQPAATGLNAISPAASRPLTAPAAGVPPPLIASRWPEPSSANPSANPAPAAADTDDSDVQPTPPAAAPPPPRCARRRGRTHRKITGPVRLDSDAVGCHDRRIVAGRPDRKRNRQVRRPAPPQWKRDRSRSRRDMGCDQDRAEVISGVFPPRLPTCRGGRASPCRANCRWRTMRRRTARTTGSRKCWQGWPEAPQGNGPAMGPIAAATVARTSSIRYGVCASAAPP